MAGPPAPPPPPPPGGPSFQSNSKPPKLPSVTPDRNALLSAIRKGKSLKKAVTNDRSSPITGGGGVIQSNGSSKSAGARAAHPSPPVSTAPEPSDPVGAQLAGILSGGMPKLRHVGGAPAVPTSAPSAPAVPSFRPSGSKQNTHSNPSIPGSRPHRMFGRKPSNKAPPLPNNAPPIPGQPPSIPSNIPSIPSRPSFQKSSSHKSIPNGRAFHKKVPSIPGNRPSVPTNAPSIPDSAPPLPDNAPPLPGNAPPLPGNAPPLPGNAPPLPGNAPVVPTGRPKRKSHRLSQEFSTPSIPSSHPSPKHTSFGKKLSAPPIPNNSAPSLPNNAAPSIPNPPRMPNNAAPSIPKPPSMPNKSSIPVPPSLPNNAFPKQHAQNVPKPPILPNNAAPSIPKAPKLPGSVPPAPSAPPPPAFTSHHPSGHSTKSASPPGALPFLAEINERRNDSYVVDSNAVARKKSQKTSAPTEQDQPVVPSKSPSKPTETNSGSSNAFLSAIMGRQKQFHDKKSHSRVTSDSSVDHHIQNSNRPPVPGLADIIGHSRTPSNASSSRNQPLPISTAAPAIPTIAAPSIPSKHSSPPPPAPRSRSSSTFSRSSSTAGSLRSSKRPPPPPPPSNLYAETPRERLQQKPKHTIFGFGLKHTVKADDSRINNQQGVGNSLRTIDASAYTIGASHNDSAASSRLVINDSRFSFTTRKELPTPRKFTGYTKLYPSGRGSSVPLNFANLQEIDE